MLTRSLKNWIDIGEMSKEEQEKFYTMIKNTPMSEQIVAMLIWTTLSHMGTLLPKHAVTN